MSALISDFDAPLPGPLYWDASFLVHATYPAGRYHRECYAFLERLGSVGDTFSYVSTLVLDETLFTLIRLRVVEDHPGRGFWEVYRENHKSFSPIWKNFERWWSACRLTPASGSWGQSEGIYPPRWTIWTGMLVSPAMRCTWL